MDHSNHAIAIFHQSTFRKDIVHCERLLRFKMNRANDSDEDGTTGKRLTHVVILERDENV